MTHSGQLPVIIPLSLAVAFELYVVISFPWH